MTCQELIEFLMSFLDGELPRVEKRRFDQHLEGCPECTRYVASYRETVKLGKMICRPGDSKLPEDLPDDLIEAILAARRA